MRLDPKGSTLTRVLVSIPSRTLRSRTMTESLDSIGVFYQRVRRMQIKDKSYRARLVYWLSNVRLICEQQEHLVQVTCPRYFRPGRKASKMTALNSGILEVRTGLAIQAIPGTEI